jgi:membrane fusion protein (multidrug efflux system)
MLLAVSSALLSGCHQSAPAAPAGQVPEVTVFTVQSKPLSITTELAGRTSAYQVAEVRPQVGGIVQKRLFTEGSDVKAGTSLYQIDPATYMASYNSAKASLAKAEAALLTSRPKAERYKALLDIQGVSKQDYDDAVATYEEAKADVESAKAALDTARINNEFTRVTAPISGRIGQSSVTAGALVTASQTTALTTISQLDPIYVDVTQTATDLLRLKRELENGSLKRVADNQAKVSLLLDDGSKYPLSGKLQFSDVTVDQTTGAVTVRAIFPNPKRDLLPGMYVRAVLEEGVDEQAIVVPQQGVTRNQKGEATALVLGADGKVQQRILKTAGTVGNQWRVTAGLKSGDQLIVEGLQKVKPGAQAKAAAAPATAPAAADQQGSPVAAAKPAAASN